MIAVNLLLHLFVAIFWSSLREQQLHLKLEGPLGSAIGLLSVPERLKLEVHGLFAETNQTADTSAEGHRPALVFVRLPVRTNGRGGTQVPALVKVVIDEILEAELIYIRLTTFASEVPDILRQKSKEPLAWLNQSHEGWTC